MSKIKTFEKKTFDSDNGKFTHQECRKIRIIKRIFPRVEFKKFSNNRDSNYGIDVKIEGAFKFI